MTPRTASDRPLHRVLRRQLGLITAAQAASVGVSDGALRRRLAGPTGCWRRVLPRVYATFVHPLTNDQKVVAAVLYAGDEAIVTGLAALMLRGFRYAPAPHEVDILIPGRRRCGSRDFVRITRTTRPPHPVRIRGLPTAPVARAVVDACARLTAYDEVLAVAAEAVQRRLTTVSDLAAELAAGQRRGSALLRRAILAVGAGARSAAEARALRLFRSAGLPTPLVNRDLYVNGRWVARPDFRWGRLIVEIDSKEWHLLAPGSWEATQRRRRRLEQLGFDVLVVTPEELRDTPRDVVAVVRAHCLRPRPRPAA